MPPLTPGSFRHIWSTRMAEMGVAPTLAAKMRRDKDGGTMFLRTYVHPRPEMLREVVVAQEALQ
jgi:integrase